jgi:hypothetical protein
MFIDTVGLKVDFLNAADLAHTILEERALSIEVNAAPHKRPKSLPKGKMAVYVFMWGEQCLKVGKVGSNSQARFTSHHYSPASSNSNLAKSIFNARSKMGLHSVTESNVGEWIETNLDRINFMLDDSCDIALLNLLEAFMQCRLKPIFEGFESQRA